MATKPCRARREMSSFNKEKDENKTRNNKDPDQAKNK